MTTANKITLIRVAFIPLFMFFLLLNAPFGKTVALVIFILASVTDWIDGYIARNYNQVTNLGKFLDPLADKLLVTAALLVFAQWGQMPAWAVMIILTREFAVTGMRLVAASEGTVIAAGKSGKIKTASSLVAICFMMTALHDKVVFAGVTVDHICIAIMLVTTVYSGIEYFVKNSSVFKESK